MGCLLNRILFPRVDPTYSLQSMNGLNNRIMFEAVTTYKNYRTCSLFIPYFSDNSRKNISSKALIYFHGNAEDLGGSVNNLQKIKDILKVNVFANQYPRYGIHGKPKCNHKSVNQDAVTLYRYVNQTLKFSHEDIIVVGRSIGTGPACYVAAQTQCKYLVLISPFSSISAMVKQKVKLLCWLNLFPSVFPNMQNIRRAQKAKLLVIHGKSDEVINVQNSYRIQDYYINTLNRDDGEFIFHDNKTHNNFDFRNDIIKHIGEFLNLEEQIRPYDPVIRKINNHVIKGLGNYRMIP